MKRLMLLSSALIFSATMSLAAITADDLVASYQAEGYTRIEVKTGLTQIKVEAISGSTKVEVIYDAATGAILKQQTRTVNGANAGSGVQIATVNRDFIGGGSGGNDDDDDSMDDDSDDDHGGSDDDHDDDRRATTTMTTGRITTPAATGLTITMATTTDLTFRGTMRAIVPRDTDDQSQGLPSPTPWQILPPRLERTQSVT